jgi:hypothetical protein
VRTAIGQRLTAHTRKAHEDKKSHAKTQRRKDEGQNSRKEAQKTQKSDTGQDWF